MTLRKVSILKDEHCKLNIKTSYNDVILIKMNISFVLYFVLSHGQYHVLGKTDELCGETIHSIFVNYVLGLSVLEAPFLYLIALRGLFFHEIA